jgi:hypothetical protein
MLLVLMMRYSWVLWVFKRFIALIDFIQLMHIIVIIFIMRFLPCFWVHCFECGRMLNVWMLFRSHFFRIFFRLIVNNIFTVFMRFFYKFKIKICIINLRESYLTFKIFLFTLETCDLWVVILLFWITLDCWDFWSYILILICCWDSLIEDILLFKLLYWDWLSFYSFISSLNIS